MDDNNTQQGRDFVLFVAAAFLLLFILYTLVFRQLEYISSFWVLLVIVFVLLTISFLASACEAAFNVAKFFPEVQDKIDEDKSETVLELIGARSEFDIAVQKNDSGRKSLKKQSKLHKRLFGLIEMSRSLMTGKSVHYTNSLAVTNVITNVAGVALLPLAISKADHSGFLEFSLPVFAFQSEPSLSVFISSWKTVDLTSSELLVFGVATIPVIVFGKMIPNALGQKYPLFFAVRLHWFGKLSQKFFGWISSGFTAPLKWSGLI